MVAAFLAAFMAAGLFEYNFGDIYYSPVILQQQLEEWLHTAKKGDTFDNWTTSWDQDKADVKDGIITYKIAAHAADLAKGFPHAQVLRAGHASTRAGSRSPASPS